MTQQLVQTQTFTVNFLSPVHIGTGEQLDNHECVYENGRIFRFRITPILERMNDHQLAQFVDNGLEAVKDWLRKSGLWQKFRLYESTLPRQPNWYREPIRPFIADPFFRPYLPGTEVKGAIRTAVVWWLLKNSNKGRLKNLVGKRKRNNQVEDEKDRRWAGQWFEQTLLGTDPNHDLLRSLRVQDSTPVSPQRLKVFPVLVVIRTNTGLRWLQSPRRGNQRSQYTDDRNQAVANFCECLDASVVGVTLTVTEDKFLQGGRVRKDETELVVPEELMWDDEGLRAVEDWQRACNEFAREVAEKERSWWQQVKTGSRNLGTQMVAAMMERFYENLLKQIQVEAGKAVFINLGWGSGWRTKTVTEEFGDETVQEVVNKYGLDRGAGSRPFPKTRKVVWLGGNEFVPMGWIKLVPRG